MRNATRNVMEQEVRNYVQEWRWEIRSEVNDVTS